MKTINKDPANLNVAGEIIRLCENIQTCRGKVEKRGEEKQIRMRFEELCNKGLAALAGMESPPLAIALMDAYEITQDGKMLQAVLDAAARMIPRLQPSKESVRLLSYCYYYVEDEECGLLARKMLEELRGNDDFSEADQIFQELVGNH